MKKPNILLLFADDQRFDTIRALGNDGISTPNMDALAASGTAFTHAHIPGGTCGAVCMPSRAMLHTGRTLYHLQDEGQEIPKDHTLLGEYLLEQGYDCHGIGKWHNGSDAYARSFNSGAEIFFGGMWDHWNVPAHHYDPTGRYESAVPYISDAFHSREVTVVQSDHISPGCHSTDLFADAAAGWLEDLDSREDPEKPFFLNLAFMAPHDPRSMPPEYLEMYPPEEVELPSNFAAEHLFDFGIRDVRDEILAPYPRTENEVKRHIAEYYAMISHLDDRIGRVLDALEKSGRREDTIVIFAGDNGLALGQHGLFGKQSAYEHSIRIPLIFNGPGIPSGEMREQPCYLLDIFPTLVDLLDGEMPESVEGRSLKPVMADAGSAPTRDAMYFAYEDKLRAVKSGSMKLVEYAFGNTRETQLFNLEDDPAEVRNIAGANPEEVASLRRQMHRLRDEWDDRCHSSGQRFWAACGD